MSRRLSVEFRRWSLWYPASWRADSGAAMLGVYLDVADAEGRDRLARRDKAAIVAGGLNARLDLLIPARVRDGVAAVMLPLLGVYALVVGLVFEWDPWATTSRAHWLAQVSTEFGGDRGYSFGPFLTPTVIVAALAILALLACLAGLGWLYRGALVATIVAGLTVMWMAHFGIGGFAGLRSLPPFFAALLAFLALLGARPRPGRTVISTVLWAAALYPAAHVSGEWTLHDFLSGGEMRTDSLFFLVVVGPDAAWVASILGLVAALVLTIARRRSLAAIMVICTLPFAAYAPGPLIWQDVPLMWVPLAVGYATAAVIMITSAPRRSRVPA